MQIAAIFMWSAKELESRPEVSDFWDIQGHGDACFLSRICTEKPVEKQIGSAVDWKDVI